MRRALVAALAATVALGAGCGGDDKETPAPENVVAHVPAPPEGADPSFAAVNGLAEDTAPELPSGREVARSDFDLSKDGFAFANYSKSSQKMRAEEMVELFGDSVCATGSGATCVLTPEAERWRIMGNEVSSGGHCMGFSVLSLRMYNGELDPSTYGADTAWDLRIADEDGRVINPELAADLARDSATQAIPAVQPEILTPTPRELIDLLTRSLEQGAPHYVLGVTEEDAGGHAIIPTAIEDMGGGKFDVLVYDNNWPYIEGAPESSERRMHVDVNAGTWEFLLSTNPSNPQHVWEGTGGEAGDLVLFELPDLSLPKPCPVCGRRAGPGEGKGLGQLNTIALTGSPQRFARLRVTDDEGNVTGWDGERYVNEIPGASIREPFVLQREKVRPEPLYEIPQGTKIQIELVDVREDAPPAQMHVSGPGVGVGLSRVTQQGTTLGLSADGDVTVDRVAGADAAPLLLQVAVDGDREVELTPRSDTVRVVSGDGGLRVTGRVVNATVSDADTGDSRPLPGSARSFGTFNAG